MRLFVVVKPNSKEESVLKNSDGSYTARVRARPVEGQANKALVKLLARHFGAAPSQVSIASGGKARRKVVEIAS